MKNVILSLALLALSLGGSASVGLAGSAALRSPPPVTQALRCAKDLITVDGVTEEQAVLFVGDGFSCEPE